MFFGLSASISKSLLEASGKALVVRKIMTCAILLARISKSLSCMCKLSLSDYPLCKPKIVLKCAIFKYKDPLTIGHSNVSMASGRQELTSSMDM